MERAVAIKKLTKMLGKQFGYQLDPDAKTAEEKEPLKALLVQAVNERNELAEKAKLRREAILAARSPRHGVR